MKKFRSFLFKSLIVLVVTSPFLVSARNGRDTLDVGHGVNFSENKGQWAPNVRFLANMHASSLFLEEDCFTFLLQHPDNGNLRHIHDAKWSDHFRTHAYKVHFLNAQKASMTGMDALEGCENYFLGKDPSRWASGVRQFRTVLYQGLYNDIDLKVYSTEHSLKYDFLVHPFADASQIALLYEGVDGLRIADGNVIIHTSVIDLVELKPYAYQLVDGKEVEVASSYVLKGNIIRIALGDYDHSRDLVIDPHLFFSTYTGSTADNWGTTGAYDSYKNTYTAGLVFGANYPTSLGAYDGHFNGNADIGIFKFDTSGSQRLYATYLGGSYADMPHSIFVNSFDELVIFGTTGSSDFPTTPNAFDTSFNGGYTIDYESSQIHFPIGSDIFISRFSADGSQLMASTFVGGSGNDGLNYRDAYNDNQITLMLGTDSLYFNYGDGARGELITDDLNNIYVGSTSFSYDFPTTPNAFQPQSNGGQEGVVFKIDYNLSNMLWASYIGGFKDDAVYSIDVDEDYNLLVCGGTNSIDFPTTNGAYRTFYNGGSADGFVAKISYYGNNIMCSSTFGSNAYDQCYFVRCGKKSEVFIFGQTKASGSTLIHNANYNTPNSGQFLARLSPNLDTLRWSTVFGTGNGEPNISPTAFMADICNRVYLAGWGRKFCGYNLGGVIPWNATGTWGMTVTQDAYQSLTDGQDFYLMALSDDASNLLYASFFGEIHTNGSYGGNDHVDGGTSRFDKTATLYQSVCASCGGADAFPTSTGVWSEHNCSNNCNNAIFRINLKDDFPVAECVAPPAGCAPYTVDFHNTGRGDSFHWDFGDGNSSSAENPSHTYASPGSYTVTLIAEMPDGCKTADTFHCTILVLGHQNYSLDTLSTCPSIALQIGMRPMLGCSYQWVNTQGHLSDSSIANPYTSHSGDYVLLISNGSCQDTVHQIVQMGHANFSIPHDTSTCVSPFTINAQAEGSGIIYHWSSNNAFSDTLNSDMSLGIITVELNDSLTWLYIHVVDDLGCEKTDSILIHFSNILDHLVVHNVSCPHACDGEIRIIPNEIAYPPYQVMWDNAPWSSDTLRNNLCSGSHTVVFRDSKGCQVRHNVFISEPEEPIFTKTLTHVLCHESCTGEASISVNGPNPPYSIQWPDNGSNENPRTNLCPGVYYFYATDANGCVSYDTLEILENADFRVHASFNANTCPDECSGDALAVAQGGTAPYSYQWSSGEMSASANGLCEGWAVVEVVDASGCVVKDSVMIGTQESFQNIQVWADENVVFKGESTKLHVTPIDNATYDWSPKESLKDFDTPNPEASPTDSTTYIVTITDSAGCVYTDSIRISCITVDCGKTNIAIPNIFTPNGDGKNDRLCITGEWITDFYIAIFTRWGEMVYESHDIYDCWDGRYKDNWCMPGVYTYLCRVKCEAGQEGEFKGDITLIR